VEKRVSKVLFSLTILLIIILFYSNITIAHGNEPDKHIEDVSKKNYNLADPLFYIKLTAAILIIITLFSLTIGKNYTNEHKKIFFWILTLPVVLSSLYLAGHTIYGNLTSVTKGPVHWHAHYQVWTCGERLDLQKAEGLSNRMGSSVLHSHEDDSIHVEGVVYDFMDITLGKYFQVIGGELEHDRISYPTVNGIVNYKNGDLCDNLPGKLKVYVNGEKIENPELYVIAPEENVPPGDCIIFEFSPGDSNITEKICDSWAAKGWSYEKRGDD
jgi:hypothetical protein